MPSSRFCSMITPVSWLGAQPDLQGAAGPDQQQGSRQCRLSAIPCLWPRTSSCTGRTACPWARTSSPHLELTREIAPALQQFLRRFLSRAAGHADPGGQMPWPGDGRKMSKSYSNNGIFLSDSMKDIADKVRAMFTYPPRERKSDPGNPRSLQSFPLPCAAFGQDGAGGLAAAAHPPALAAWTAKDLPSKTWPPFSNPCRKGAGPSKSRPGAVEEILEAGNIRAMAFASKTMQGVREKMNL